MASLKVYFICALLVLGAAVQGQKDKKKNAAAKPAAAGTQTRGNFGFNQGGGAYRPGVGNVGLGGGFNQHRPHGVGVGVGGFNQHRPHGVGVGGGFNQHRPVGVGGGFNQHRPVGVGGFGQAGGFGQPGVGVGGYQPGVGVGGHAGVGGLGGHAGVGGLGGLAGVHAGLGGAGASAARPATCRYWCRTPEGKAYCCENANQAPKPDIASQVVKAGQCPPVRAECPLRIFGGPPEPCSKHGDCNGIDRCCFDRCLNEHVCKAPQGYGK